MNKEELNEILDNHKKWLNVEPGGKKADLRDADLRGANLYGADLWIYSGDDVVWALVRAELERKIAEDRMRRKHENAD